MKTFEARERSATVTAGSEFADFTLDKLRELVAETANWSPHAIVAASPGRVMVTERDYSYRWETSQATTTTSTKGDQK